MAFHFVNNGRPTPGIPVVGRREPPMSLSLNIASLRTSQAFRQEEGHVDFPLVEGLGRPQVCNVKNAEIGGSRLPTTGMPGVGIPFCQKLKTTNGSPMLNSYHRLDGFAGGRKLISHIFRKCQIRPDILTQPVFHYYDAITSANLGKLQPTLKVHY